MAREVADGYLFGGAECVGGGLMAKMSAFDRDFKKPCWFDWDGLLVVSRASYDREQAVNVVYELEGVRIDPALLEEGWVKWRGCPNENGEFVNGWWTCSAYDRGTRPVWLLDGHSFRRAESEQLPTILADIVESVEERGS